MIKIHRIINLNKLLQKKSYFLLGPRQTGKSFLIRNQLKPDHVYNLLERDTFQKLAFNTALIRQEVLKKNELVVIDEIQKLPELLDEVHNLIEEKNIRFLLTGSSARKLKKYGTNLLGGRARLQYLHPFIYHELKNHFDLNKVLNYGLIPSIYFSDDPEADIEAYIGLYLQQEIANEGLTRNLPAFSRFLEVAALSHAEQVNYTSISNDAQIPRTTVHEYFEILKDTLIAYELPAWKQTVKRKPIATPKYYFFDWGIVRKLQKLGRIQMGSSLAGKAFESYIFHEVMSYCHYNGIKDLCYWRTTGQDEVDFILNSEIAIEVKSSKNIHPSDLKGLIRLKEENIIKKFYLVYHGEKEITLEVAPFVRILPYKKFLDILWSK
jgi:predicted AAA+ superfamily ATPase